MNISLKRAFDIKRAKKTFDGYFIPFYFGFVTMEELIILPWNNILRIHNRNKTMFPSISPSKKEICLNMSLSPLLYFPSLYSNTHSLTYAAALFFPSIDLCFISSIIIDVRERISLFCRGRLRTWHQRQTVKGWRDRWTRSWSGQGFKGGRSRWRIQSCTTLRYPRDWVRDIMS